MTPAPTLHDPAGLPAELRLVHPLTGAEYMIRSENRIEISLDGRTGIYDGVGRLVEGDLVEVDPQVCRWLDSGWLTRGAARNRRYVSDGLATDPS